VAAIAGTDVIVGVDQFSDFPPAVADLPKVGGFMDPSLEAILRLQPDLVVLDRVQSKVDDGLRAAGIRTLVLQMETASDVTAGLAAVGAALDRADAADRVIAQVNAELADVQRLAAEARGDGPRPQVLFIVDRALGGLGNMVAAGPDTYIDELITLAGGDNVLADSPVRFARISVEQVLTRAPDVIIDAVHTNEIKRAASDWSVLSTVPAVANGRVHVLGDAMHTHPSPRLGQSLRRIAEAVNAL
jgi:iron complex transport system substrate-binding protein